MANQPNINNTIFLPLVQRGGSGQSPVQPAIYIDLERCIGCNACSLACKQENNVSIGGRWNEVYGMESVGLSTPDIRVLPMYCQHCDNAPCKQKCDSLGFHAIIKRPCLGCPKEQLTIQSLRNLYPTEIKSIQLLGVEAPLVWSLGVAGLTIQLTNIRPGEPAYVFKIVRGHPFES